MNISNNYHDDSDLHIELSGQNSGRSADDDPDLKVFVEINKSSSRFILDYSYSDTSQELGGVLLGSCNENDGQYRVCVEAAIEARYTEAAKGSVTFTHQSWDYINQVREEKYPQHSVVGWFHTHPGFGIFLSGYDKFIHQNFFNLPWQIAYVVDPLANKHGFFGWHNNNLEQIPFKAEISPAPAPVKATPLDVKKAKPAVYGRIASTAAMIALLLLSGYLYVSYGEANQRIGELEFALLEREGSLTILQGEIIGLQEAYNDLELLVENKSQPDPFYVYTVVENDSLIKISERFLGDGQLYQSLAGLNNLINPDLIYPGDKLLIPSGLIILE